MDYWHRPWACPFFHWDEMKRIHCEGGCVLSFPDKEAIVDYMDRHCANVKGYKDCTVAAAMLKYYERKEQQDDEGKHPKRR